MSFPIQKALYGKMAGDTTLNNMLASPPVGANKSIFHQMAPEGADLPFVIFQKQSGTPTYAMSTLAMDNEVWMVKGVARSGTTGTAGTAGASAISTRLNQLLTDGAISISGSTQLYLRRESDVEYAEEVDGVRYQHAGALYRLIYQSP